MGADMTLGWIAGLFLAAAVAIVVAGIRLTHLADRIADATRLGQATVGAVLLGGTTSLSGIVTSAVAAMDGAPALAIGNAIGGIAVQTAFLAVADLFYRRGNLEHGADSIENLGQATLLLGLLAVPLAATGLPVPQGWPIHPASLMLVFGYGIGLRLLTVMSERPMWHARGSRQAHPSDTEAATGVGVGTVAGFLACALVVGVAGFVLARTGVALADRTALGETAVGGLLTAVVTSLPELVTALAAVRLGALNLAIGGILGGNAFDVLFLAIADVAYWDGPIYAAMTGSHLFVLAASQVMTAVLLLGLLVRQRRGPAGIGFESAAVLLLYAATAVVMAVG